MKNNQGQGVILTKTQVGIWYAEVAEVQEQEALAIKLANFMIELEGLTRISPFIVEVPEEGGIYISRSELQNSWTVLAAAAVKEDRNDVKRPARLNELALLLAEVMQMEAEFDFLLAPIPGSKEPNEEDGIERDRGGVPMHIESLDALGQIAHGAGVVQARLKREQSEERIAALALAVWQEFALDRTFATLIQERALDVFQEQFKRGYLQIIERM